MSKQIDFNEYKRKVRKRKIKKDVCEVFYRAIGVMHKNKDFILLAIPVFDLILHVIFLIDTKEE